MLSFNDACTCLYNIPKVQMQRWRTWHNRAARKADYGVWDQSKLDTANATYICWEAKFVREKELPFGRWSAVANPIYRALHTKRGESICPQCVRSISSHRIVHHNWGWEGSAQIIQRNGVQYILRVNEFWIRPRVNLFSYVCQHSKRRRADGVTNSKRLDKVSPFRVIDLDLRASIRTLVLCNMK